MLSAISCLCIAAWTRPLVAEEVRLPMTGQADERLQGFDRMVADLLREQESPGGAALAVSRQGKLVYARGFGYADEQRKTHVQVDSLFRIASISKPITAVAIFQLIQQGKLSLDDRVFDIVKEPPHLPDGARMDPRLSKITIRQLLQHTGGWDRGKSFDAMFQSVRMAKSLGSPPPAGQRQIIQFMMGVPLDFDPGSDYAYSNYGYCLLGRVIEEKSGEESYEKYVQKRVLSPIAVTRMKIGRTRVQGRAKGEVSYHDREGKKGSSVFADHLDERVPQPYGAWHLEAMDSHGAWLASAVDLVRFADAVSFPDRFKVVTAKHVEAMYARPPKPVGRDGRGEPKRVYYGCGWNVRLVDQGGEGRNTWHTGSLPGTSTILVRRYDGLNWAVLFNSRDGADGKRMSAHIDGRMHRVANAVKEWPTGDLYPRYGIGK